MTDLDLADASMAGLVAWYSLIHVPDDEIGSVLRHFQRVLRPGGPLLLSFHIGDESRLKTQGYGGHPMKVYVHRRRPCQMSAWLNDAGFTVEAHRTLSSAESTLGESFSRAASPTPGKEPHPARGRADSTVEDLGFGTGERHSNHGVATLCDHWGTCARAAIMAG